MLLISINTTKIESNPTFFSPFDEHVHFLNQILMIKKSY